MSDFAQALDAVASETGFSGVVRVDRGNRLELEQAWGYAHRGYEIPNTVDTRFGTASGTKTLTALAVIGLIEDGVLELTTTARALLGDDLPLIDDDVTVEQLLAHRSGIGDYLDENVEIDLSDYLMPVPVHELAAAEDYLAVLGGYPQKFSPGKGFSYCNGGYVVLALIAERASGIDYHDLVARRVLSRAGMTSTSFLRSDEPPGGVALGYMDADGLRTNVLHLPVRGVGDGGAYTTVADVRALWVSLFEGGIVSLEWVQEMTRPRSDVPEDRRRYGLGFWLDETSDVVVLEGMDAGVSFVSKHDPGSGWTSTVVSNTTLGAWPVARVLDAHFPG
jgi:CubicO group peptidase (beta-lactamase class C family)